MLRPLYLDCEFNSHRGHLISLALYDPLENKNFYEVDDLWETTVKYPESHGLTVWVRENVIPMLCKKAIPDHQMRALLTNYLYEFDDLIIYADWPDDFVHLMRLLCYVESNDNIPKKIIPNLKFELITTPDKHISRLPHNALEDAKALHLNHMEMLKNV